MKNYLGILLGLSLLGLNILAITRAVDSVQTQAEYKVDSVSVMGVPFYHIIGPDGDIWDEVVGVGSYDELEFLARMWTLGGKTDHKTTNLEIPKSDFEKLCSGIISNDEYETRKNEVAAWRKKNRQDMNGNYLER